MSWAPPGIPSDVIDFHLHRALANSSESPGTGRPRGTSSLPRSSGSTANGSTKRFRTSWQGCRSRNCADMDPAGSARRRSRTMACTLLRTWLGGLPSASLRSPGSDPRPHLPLKQLPERPPILAQGAVQISLDDDPDNRLLLTALYRLLLWEQISRSPRTRSGPNLSPRRPARPGSCDPEFAGTCQARTSIGGRLSSPFSCQRSEQRGRGTRRQRDEPGLRRTRTCPGPCRCQRTAAALPRHAAATDPTCGRQTRRPEGPGQHRQGDAHGPRQREGPEPGSRAEPEPNDG